MTTNCLFVQFAAMSRSGQGSAILMILVALICLLVLLLPLEGESSGWPSYIHATVNQKLIAAFALGILADTHTEIEFKICELKANVSRHVFLADLMIEIA